MAINSQYSEKDLSVYEETRLVRRGLLLYYDGLLFSDMADQGLYYLNTVSTTLPAETLPTLPNYINAHFIDLEITVESS